MCQRGVRKHRTASAAIFPVRHKYKVLTIYGHWRSQRTFWKVRLLIPVCWPKSIFSDATLAVSISCVIPDGDSVGHCILFQTACWAPLCFGTADIFQKQPCCGGVWSDLYISLTRLTGMEWGLISYDQIIIPVKSKERFFWLAFVALHVLCIQNMLCYAFKAGSCSFPSGANGVELCLRSLVLKPINNSALNIRRKLNTD